MKNDAAHAKALVPRTPEAPYGLDDARLQKLWLATQRRDWRSLAVIAATSTVDTYPIAETLAKIAWWYRGQPSCVFDLRDLSLRLVEYQLGEVRGLTEGGTRVIISLRSITENPTAIPIAKQADAAVICISMGKTEFRSAEQTIEEIGRSRVLGAIVLRDAASSKKRSTPPSRGRA